MLGHRIHDPLRLEVGRFAVVGAGNAIVDAAVFALVVAATGWDTGPLATLAAGLGFCAGATHSYAWNSRYTFAAAHAGDSPGVVARFAVVTLGGLALAVGTFGVLAWALPATAPMLAFAKACSMIAGLGWNYRMLRDQVFVMAPHA